MKGGIHMEINQLILNILEGGSLVLLALVLLHSLAILLVIAITIFLHVKNN